MMRNPRDAIGATAGSWVNAETMRSANAKKMTPTTPRKTTLYWVARQTDVSARSGFPAPRFCPTNVAAAFESPHDGSSTNTTTQMGMVQLAPAALPNVARIRTSHTQLLVAISIWKTAVPDSLSMLIITGGARRRGPRGGGMRPAARGKK